MRRAVRETGKIRAGGPAGRPRIKLNPALLGREHGGVGWGHWRRAGTREEEGTRPAAASAAAPALRAALARSPPSGAVAKLSSPY